MGIGYVDSIVLYNRYVDPDSEKEYYFGTQFEGVRVEMTQGANIQKSGIDSADSCKAKIPNDGSLPKPYMSPEVWSRSEEKTGSFTVNTEGCDFFVVTGKAELGIAIQLPDEMIDSDQYDGGFFQYIKETYGHAYKITTLNVYNLILRFEVGGK